MSDTPQIRTHRLDLEPVRPEHADEVWPQIDDERMWRYFERLRPARVNDLRRRYEKWQRGSGVDDEIWLNWMCRERSSGVVAGGVQATVFATQRYALVAYGIYPRFRRQGYAREATQATIAYVHERYDIDRFRAEMDIRNEPSYRLADSMGFTRIGSRERDYVYELRF